MFVYKLKSGKFLFNMLMRPEQKSTTWIKKIVQKYTKPKNIVRDASAGRIPVSKGGLLFLKC